MEHPAAELVRAAHRVAGAGLVIGSSGNISVRVAPDRFRVSACGARLADLDAAQVSTCAVADAAALEGPPPSVEAPFHAAVYRERPDVHAVLHFQSPYATALACAERPEFELAFIPELPAYISGIRLVPYRHPGTPELTQAVAEQVRDTACDLVVLLNHGQIALAADPSDALRKAEFFELACRIACQGIRLRRYDRRTIEELRRYGRKD